MKTNDQVVPEFDLELILRDEKTFLPSAHGGGRDEDNKKKKGPENSSSNIYNFNAIARTIFTNLFAVWALGRLLL